jgi:class 3 adenylate cyclase
VKVAVEMLDFLKKYNENRPPNRVWQMRIGIHTGAVVAGVVGKNKFAWDIWGDAVNTAARLEQSGQADRINISGSTFGLVQHAYRCTPRGSIAAKNKGEILMYFVETPVV